MRNFWALPAVLRIALASPHSFSVFDDILAFPQYEVLFPDTFITENSASSLLAHAVTRSTSSATTPDSQETQELSKPGKHSSPTASKDGPLEETYEAVVLGGQRYLCSIPTIPEEQPQNSTTSAEQAKADEKKELMRAADRGWQLLEGMEGNCIYYMSGWWSYSFCYNGEVKQFHQLPPSKGVPFYPPVEDTSVKSYVLGRFPKKGKDGKKGDQTQRTLDGQEGDKDGMDDEGNVKKQDSKTDGQGSEVATLETRGSARYMVQRLGAGTECDLTGRERKIEVQFHCNPQSGDRIAMIKETSTCAYMMIIHTPRLCHDVAFLPPQENFAHSISCRPVIADSEVETWTRQKLEGRIQETERLLALEEENPLRDMQEGAEGRSKRRPIIGGIEVGAKKLVGSEGKVIEKSVVVGGGKEVFLATIATSRGFQMSKEEMKKLNIQDPDEVGKWKNKLAESAGDKKWKLDLIETPQGREFRWILEADEDEEEPAKQTGSGSSNGKDNQKGKEKAKPKNTKAPKNEEEEAEEQQEGSEEVYKDEL